MLCEETKNQGWKSQNQLKMSKVQLKSSNLELLSSSLTLFKIVTIFPIRSVRFYFEVIDFSMHFLGSKTEKRNFGFEWNGALLYQEKFCCSNWSCHTLVPSTSIDFHSFSPGKDFSNWLHWEHQVSFSHFFNFRFILVHFVTVFFTYHTEIQFMSFAVNSIYR